MTDFEDRIGDLDLSLFEKIHSQTSPNDKRSLLAIQLAVRELTGEFTYLEIGSFQGGSLQPYAVDDRCKQVYSLDLRPVESADDRGMTQIYHNNTTRRMLYNLSQVDGGDLDKFTCIDGDVSDIDPVLIAKRPQLCFIDGEHTDAATWRDYEFCRKVMTENAAVIFHDAMIIYNCLDRIIKQLTADGIEFRAYNLPDVVFVIEIGDFPLHRSTAISSMLSNNHVGYLNSLLFTDQYRRFANRPAFRFLRDLKLRFTKANVTK